MQLRPLPAFADNYIWTLAYDDGTALVVDPGEAAPVLEAARGGLKPVAVLLTHHHPDHVGGVEELLQAWPELAVFAPEDTRIRHATKTVREGDAVVVGPWRFRVLEIPGHTLSHVAFHGEGIVFCGDTLFSLGCGRLFEGSPAQMWASLTKLAALPPQTRVCCGHEYTVNNSRFACVVEPGNLALRRRSEEALAMRERGLPTLPSTLADELAANPFLRVDAPEVRQSLRTRLGRDPADSVEAFAELRRWKDGFTS
ncbi:hydroxyacylglutathione hydrolase [Lysobacter solisilvae (ex Woo and Kim 2020)]|uniref:Hydroxyacylglutathione hydrolase n=1 Tax=Agrilutibacter terrestris TaxID=2865112 RepID=A0A7H0FYC6_9GAMM|nr:hydroxyacylglutathione hydrolase [Lysobacter terrestris]QNP41042.1 hydroxyacylglutathione hydrolase [Lysobacter terrestris]